MWIRFRTNKNIFNFSKNQKQKSNKLFGSFQLCEYFHLNGQFVLCKQFAYYKKRIFVEVMFNHRANNSN